jgi:hypothetical protein
MIHGVLLFLLLSMWHITKAGCIFLRNGRSCCLFDIVYEWRAGLHAWIRSRRDE